MKAGIWPASIGGWWNGCEQPRLFALVWGPEGDLLRRDGYRTDLAERRRMDAAMARSGAALLAIVEVIGGMQDREGGEVMTYRTGMADGALTLGARRRCAAWDRRNAGRPGRRG